MIVCNFDQYVYPENKLLYAARAAGVQAHGMGAQNNADYVSVSAGYGAIEKRNAEKAAALAAAGHAA